MKIAITGKNRAGKTTLMKKLLASFDNKRGMIASEVRKAGERVGFDHTDDVGNTVAIARVDFRTPYSVGRYCVDVDALQRFIEPLFCIQPGQFLYIDEIGQIQLYSAPFRDLVEKYLSADNHLLFSISAIYQDKLIDTINERNDILRCEVTVENRDEMVSSLAIALAQRDVFAKLPQSIGNSVLRIGSNYLRNGEYVYFSKLFNNAITYIAQNRIKPTGSGEFWVRGKTNDHRVSTNNQGKFLCDCDLFHGRGKFTGHRGQCSHTQAITLTNPQV